MLKGTVPSSITAQLTQACDTIERHLSSSVQAIHLFGSAVDGGLKPQSDIDLLVTVNRKLDESTRSELMLDLLNHSAPAHSNTPLRPLEVTVLCDHEVIPWRYPALRELQFGEWLRNNLLNGIIEPAIVDIDLAILLRKIREHSIAIKGPSADSYFDDVPDKDFLQALQDTLNTWYHPEDWIGDEQTVVLAVARIWYSAATGNIASKEIAATWLLQRLPAAQQPVLQEAYEAYVTGRSHDLATRSTAIAAYVLFARSGINW